MSALRFLSLVVAGGIFAFSPTAGARAPRKSPGAVEIGTDVSAVKMPVLRSAYFEKQWGKPDVVAYSDGSYRMRFRQGTTLNYFFIYGCTSAQPVPKTPPEWSADGAGEAMPSHKQEWQMAKILGKAVKWYQADGGSGADFPSYQTVDFSMTAPDGRVGIYRIIASSTSKKSAGDWIARVNW